MNFKKQDFFDIDYRDGFGWGKISPRSIYDIKFTPHITSITVVAVRIVTEAATKILRRLQRLYNCFVEQLMYVSKCLHMIIGKFH